MEMIIPVQYRGNNAIYNFIREPITSNFRLSKSSYNFGDIEIGEQVLIVRYDDSSLRSRKKHLKYKRQSRKTDNSLTLKLLVNIKVLQLKLIVYVIFVVQSELLQLLIC